MKFYLLLREVGLDVLVPKMVTKKHKNLEIPDRPPYLGNFQIVSFEVSYVILCLKSVSLENPVHYLEFVF